MWAFALALSTSLLLNPSAPPEPSPDQPSTLSDRQMRVIRLAALGLSSEVLAASGFTTSETAEVVQQCVHADVGIQQSPVAAPNAEQFVPVSTSRLEQLRADVLNGCDLSLAALKKANIERCIQGVSFGLPAELAVSCDDIATRRAAVAALHAEARAARLGRRFEGPHADMLAQLRADARTLTAQQNMSQLEAIRSITLE